MERSAYRASCSQDGAHATRSLSPRQDLPKTQSGVSVSVGISAIDESRALKTICQVTLFVFAVLVWIASPSAMASELVYSRCSDDQSVYGPTLVWPADGVNSEVADEFNVVANIDRVVAGVASSDGRLIFRVCMSASTNSVRTTNRVCSNAILFGSR